MKSIYFLQNKTDKMFLVDLGLYKKIISDEGAKNIFMPVFKKLQPLLISYLHVTLLSYVYCCLEHAG